MTDALMKFAIFFAILILVAIVVMIVRCYRKVDQGQAIVRNGMGGTKVSFTGIVVFPVLHLAEYMNISVNRIEIKRRGVAGLICKDNMRADIEVAFFVRVNKTEADVIQVATTIGCARASDPASLVEFFDAKFSEALKTVGRQFDFVELYNSRDAFRDQILKTIGTDLNGYVLDDAAIDYLEQTGLEHMNPDNILDAEGIKKITDLTAIQAKKANAITRDKERVIRQQDVETREAILELDKQLAEAEQKQKREVATITSREEAEAMKVASEQRLKSEQARIAADEEIQIAEQNKDRQIIVAQKNKERTAAVETERVEKDRLLEVTERERIVALATIEKDKAIEVEQKAIQEVIRERVIVEKAVVVEKERIKDTEAFAGADRQKQVIITKAEMEAEEGLVKEIKAAEAMKKAAELGADQHMYVKLKEAEAAKKATDVRAQEMVVEATAKQEAAEREAAAKKLLAEAVIAETAAPGLGETQVLEARAQATEKQGSADAKVMALKFEADATGIKQKAESMKIFNEAGKEHEEFKLRLNKDRDIELAEINIRGTIAEQQSRIVGEALKSAKVDIVGGETQFFDKIVSAVTAGKVVDRTIDNSKALSDVKETFFNGDPEYFKAQIGSYITEFGMTSEDIKNLTVSAALTKMMAMADDGPTRSTLQHLASLAHRLGLTDQKAGQLLNPGKAAK